MSTSPNRHRAEPRILLVGTGGVGAPCALALAEAGGVALTIVDDDFVEVENLHRQILFTDEDVGKGKPEATQAALQRRNPAWSVEVIRGRALPSTAAAWVREVDAVIDATDNFPSRFLLADACHLAGVAVVHAAAVRWTGTVASVPRTGKPCYRCLFEDLPGEAPDCATAGIVGPVCGVVGAIAAEMALLAASGDERLSGHIATFDGRTDALRLVRMARRQDCPLCGEHPSITDLDETRYLGAACAA